MAKKPRSRQLKPDELSLFCLQFSMLISAGISPTDSAGILLEEADTAFEKQLLSDLHDRLEAGVPFSAAIKENGCFPEYMQRMLEIGEVSGRLDQVLSALASYYKREDELATSLRRVVVYPVVIVLMMAAVLTVLMVEVLPVFQQVLSEMGASLSPLAMSLLTFGKASEWIAIVLVAVLALLAILLLILFRSEGKGNAVVKLFSRGSLGKDIGRSRFVSALSLMLSSGLRLDEAVKWTELLLEGDQLAPQIARCREMVEAGTDLPTAVQKTGLFTGMQSGLLSVGFRAGQSEAALEELARRCEEDTEAHMDRVLSRVEPTLIIILSVAVGLILLSVMLPLIGMLTTIG